FLEDLFEVSDPGEALGNSITAREILDRGASRIMADLQDEPEVQSRLMGTMGRVYRKLGLFEPALPLLQGAVDLRDLPASGAVPDARGALNDLVDVQLELANHEAARELLERAVVRGRDEGDSADMATSLANLGTLQMALGDYEGAATQFEEALAMRIRLFGERHEAVTDARERLAILLLYEGDFQAAIPRLETVLESSRDRYPDGHPDVAHVMDNLAAAYEEVDRSDRAEELYREALAMRIRILGEAHPQVADTWNNLGVLLNGAGRYEESEDAHRRGLAGRTAAYGERHPDVVQSLGNLATTLRRLGDEAQAERLMRQALALRIEMLGASHPDVANSQNNLAQHLQAKGEYAEADTLFAHAAQALIESVGPESPYVGIVLNGLGTTRFLAGDPALAEEPLARAVDILRAALPEGHPRLAIAHWRLGACLHELGRPDEAQPHLETAIALEDMPDERRRDLATRLASIHEKRGDADGALRYREMLDELGEP
ncbi:tetratricopeptide repeat protein, partial [bacterium]|nr:tetratricopeptide repeat protein [bacterium]